MALDIRGSRKITRINKDIFSCVDELISNSIDSYLIRKSRERALPGLKIDLEIIFNDYKTELFEGPITNVAINCTDNGDGFAASQVKAFITAGTTYKDDLSIAGIDQCKGAGRIQFLHYFRHIQIDSVFVEGNVKSRRTLHIDGESDREINKDSFKDGHANKTLPLSTTVTLRDIRQDILDKQLRGKNLRQMFSVDSVLDHIMINFLPRLVSLQEQLGDFCIRILAKNAENASGPRLLNAANLPSVHEKRKIRIPYLTEDGSNSTSSEEFVISHYKLDKSKFALKKNLVALCAKSSIVKLITHKYLPKNIETRDIDGFYHIILVESDYLNRYVNVSRDDFDIPPDTRQEDLFITGAISFAQIHDALEDVVEQLLAPPDWNREQVVVAVGSKFGISAEMISNAGVRVHFGNTEDEVVTRVLASYQKKIIDETSSIVDAQRELEKIDPASEAFRKKLNDIAWKYTASLKSIDISSLSQLVVRRAAILEILKMAIRKNLTVQKEEGRKKQAEDAKAEKRCDEKIIHNIFFPTSKDSKEDVDHDIWILSDEYHYFDYIASDKALSTYRWDESSRLFEADVDDELKKIMKKNYEDNALKRPDIAIFGKEGAVVIIEFKAPGIPLDEHTGDLMEYAQLLIAKSNGRLKKVFGYLVGNTLNPNRLRSYKKFASGHGWFGTENIVEHTTNRTLGELYSEILYYDDLVDRAEKRLAAFRKRLNFSFT